MVSSPKIPKIFECAICDYRCINKKDYNKHLLTRKHNIATNQQPVEVCLSKLACEYCKKEYKDRSGLWRHKKTCKCTRFSPPENTITYNVEEPKTADLMVLVKELMVQMTVKDKQQDELVKRQEELVKQNAELQNTMRELIPHIGNTTNNTNNTNSHNTFNIQMFLDNECKNAISIQDFIQSIEINMSHLVAMSKDGYVDSISNVLIKAFNDLAVTARPLHCTDLKRETVYVRNNDTWNKSTADTSVIGKVITTVENKHLLGIKNYIEDTPDSQVMDTPEHEFYHTTYWNTLGCGEDNAKLNKKIFKKILPSVKLDQESVQ